MTSILITTQDHLTDATQTKSLKVNPAAATGRLKTWAQMGVNLSKDSYVKTVRIDETDCDEQKTARSGQVTVGNSASQQVTDAPLTFRFTPAQVTNAYLSIRYVGTDCAELQTIADWQGDNDLLESSWRANAMPVSVSNKNFASITIACVQGQPQTITGTLIVRENEEFAQLEVPITIVVEEG